MNSSEDLKLLLQKVNSRPDQEGIKFRKESEFC